MKLLQLYEYERHRTSAGSMSEGTYRSNARMVLEGDDAFLMEQCYAAGSGESKPADAPGGAEEEGSGGALLLAFLPEKMDDDDDDVEVEEEDEEEEGDDAGKAEAVAYMQSFLLSKRSAALPRASRMLRRKAMRRPSWEKALLRNGLECRTAVGSCKLRFVWRSEDLWFANTPRAIAKRTSRKPGGSAAKRARLAELLEQRMGRDGVNALAGLGAATRAPLPRDHVMAPREVEPA